MTEYLEEINYDILIEQSLRNVVYLAMKIAEDQGLPGENHFYITFKTNFPGTVVSQNLKLQYPDTMTIVLQNQFKNLEVRYDNFSVDLSFGGILQTITVPFDAITYFADPFAKFGLNFEGGEVSDLEPKATSRGDKKGSRRTKSAQKAEIISFDKIRHRK